MGNVRLSYKKNSNNNSIDIVEANDYYPFGMKHTIAGEIPVANTNPALKYKYNGKELQDELGLGVYDYGARNYDPAIGRWFNIDPLAEKYTNLSPYIIV
ncbi:RHS repeat domain-containing protein [Flavobacterium rhizosphaerae]|uniref:RHS repeat-associated core domain-containing protein n=1 Tax=Flavobacterium rhizosphaerae TaxID=3163298 RepID=A0ABW8Z1Q2_9FLAO